MACQPKSDNLETQPQETAMVLLHIALKDGFVNDEVVIEVNDKEVFHQTKVKTKFQIGLATSWETNLEKGLINIEVKLPLKNLSQAITLELNNPTYLGVSITPEDKLDIQVSAEPFRYL